MSEQALECVNIPLQAQAIILRTMKYTVSKGMRYTCILQVAVCKLTCRIHTLFKIISGVTTLYEICSAP